jgi:menaquinone-dependent protoporphyrinogen oxidase
MTKILVTYATKTGCTRDVADKIGSVLTEAGAAVDVIPTEDKPSPASYDAVIVGSGVRAGHWHRAATKFVEANAASLAGRPLALFTVCLTMAQGPEKADEVLAYTTPMLTSTGLQPVGHGLFAGWFEPDKFGVIGRTILKQMKAPEGDHRDWEAIAAWSRNTASGLGV